MIKDLVLGLLILSLAAGLCAQADKKKISPFPSAWAIASR